MLPKLTLVLGGAASGKSHHAETLAKRTGLPLIYIATAQIFDDEMAAKVSKHKKMRGDDWTTIEEPIEVAKALKKVNAGHTVLIDCATLWLTNVLLGEHDLERAQSDLLDALQTCKSPVVVVSNEVGQGIVPDNKLARQFRNAQGALNQALAAQADRVVAVMAGLPLTLKEPSA